MKIDAIIIIILVWMALPSVLWHCWLGGRKGIRSVKIWGDGWSGHWVVWMEWHLPGWSVCLPLLIFPYTIKSRSALMAPAHPGGPGKRAIKWLWCVVVVWMAKSLAITEQCTTLHQYLSIPQQPLCHSLPRHLRNNDISREQFTCDLKTFLFARGYLSEAPLRTAV